MNQISHENGKIAGSSSKLGLTCLNSVVIKQIQMAEIEKRLQPKVKPKCCLAVVQGKILNLYSIKSLQDPLINPKRKISCRNLN